MKYFEQEERMFKQLIVICGGNVSSAARYMSQVTGRSAEAYRLHYYRKLRKADNHIEQVQALIDDQKDKIREAFRYGRA